MTRRLIAAATLTGLSVGAVLYLAGAPAAGADAWAAATAVVLAPLVWSVVRSLARRDVGVDAIALIAITTALALGQFLAGVVVALMLAGGNALEEFAAGRAGRELTRLLERMPRVAHRRQGGAIEEVAVDQIRPGDLVVVRAGEVTPVDGVIATGEAVLDESALTGEALPVSRSSGAEVRSGSANAGDVFELRVTHAAADSAYAAIVRLVRGAQNDRAPFVRLADRYAAIFLPVTLAVAGAAWAISGSAVRFLAVMVVATPCPLILAAPIAFVAGVSRAARQGVIVKGGGVIEKLGEARTVLLDKTGTVTLGSAAVEDVVALDGLQPAELLRLAASVDQLSAHALAEALVRDAIGRGLLLSAPVRVKERPGQGIEGSVAGRRVAVGSSSWLRERGYAGAEKAGRRLDEIVAPGRARILVGVNGDVAGAVVMADRLRPDSHDLIDRLRADGIRHIALVTGDRASVAEAVGSALAVDRVYAERTPEGKLDVVRALRARSDLRPVIMVGDGINDAPALALADVGIAMGSPGASVSSDTADAVIVLDRIDRVVDGIRIGRRSLAIARQSVFFGMGLSLIAMGFAAAGMIAPVFGAVLQEAIDVAVIANALRALR
ncbi:MAG: heavy metal translocating P-type ATPase [Candidatus Doudnabacteria bacterium]